MNSENYTMEQKNRIIKQLKECLSKYKSIDKSIEHMKEMQYGDLFRFMRQNAESFKDFRFQKIGGNNEL